jgi:outer membrane lipoprotein
MSFRAFLRTVVPGLLPLLLAACTSVEFEGTESRISATPRQLSVAPGPIDGTVGETVVWGGRIVALVNQAGGTEFQVLAVPLERGNVPHIGEASVGRFIAWYPGFLEPEDYSPGRWVTLAGTLEGRVTGSVDGRPVQFPYVYTGQVHLWPRDMSRWTSRAD